MQCYTEGTGFTVSGKIDGHEGLIDIPRSTNVFAKTDIPDA
jgi:hypothetical protein